MIRFNIEDRNGERQPIDIPEGIQLTLMEVIKAAAYPISAACGGMALCATCHVRVVRGADALPPVNDAEGALLDTLPNAGASSRLACQLPVDESLEGAVFRLEGED